MPVGRPYQWMISPGGQASTPSFFSTAIVWLDETTIITGGTPGGWTNKGTGGAQFDYDEIHTRVGDEGDQIVNSDINGIACIKSPYAGSNNSTAYVTTDGDGDPDLFNFAHSHFIVFENDEVDSNEAIFGNYSNDGHPDSTLRNAAIQDANGKYRAVSGNLWTADYYIDESPHVAAVRFDNGNYELWLDGESIATDASGADPLGYLPGVLFNGGGRVSYFDGKIGEYLAFGSALSDAQMMEGQDLLLDKWKIRPTASALIAAALCHYDETTITGSPTVTAWTNKGTGGSDYDYDVQIGGTPGNLTVGSVNGLDCLNFAGDAALETTADQDITVTTTQIVVLKRAGTDASTYVICDARSDTNKRHSLLSNDDGGGNATWRHFQGAGSLGGEASNDTDVHVLAGNFKGGVDSRILLDDGTHINDVSSGTDTYGFGSIGAKFDATNFWEGDICEMLVWDDDLTHLEVNTVIASLTSKWVA